MSDLKQPESSASLHKEKFQQFSKPIWYDEKAAVEMSCPEDVAKRLVGNLVGYESGVELCCAIGMLSVQLAKQLQKLYAVEIIHNRIECAKLNAREYGIDNIEFIEGDALSEEILKQVKDVQVAVLDPDWRRAKLAKVSAERYIYETEPSLKEMFDLTIRYVNPHIIVARLPTFFNLEPLKEMGPCRLETVIRNGKVDCNIAYFGPAIKTSSESRYSL